MSAAVRFKSIGEIGKHCRVRSEMPLKVNLCLVSILPLKPKQGKQKTGESKWQRRLFDHLIKDGFSPVWEHRGAIPNRRFVVDIAFPECKLAIEVDGWQHHGKTLSAFKSDRTRQNLFVVHGWRVLRFFPGEILKNMAGCVGTIKAALGQI